MLNDAGIGLAYALLVATQGPFAFPGSSQLRDNANRRLMRATCEPGCERSVEAGGLRASNVVVER